jgi:two-component system, cell cycle sensor histidine kinase and response regulator CckA
MKTSDGKPKNKNKINVSGIDVEWKPKKGTCTFEKLPVAMMWVDTTLAGLMSGVQAMVGTERFNLALQSEGRKSIEDDWKVISQFADFKEGFKVIANIAAVAGWGHWELISFDETKKECHFRVKDSWEGLYQKALGVNWGSSMAAGKMAGYCTKLFETNCWADQTSFIARGDPFDEFKVKPSPRSIENEIDSLLATDEATRADMAVALNKLQNEIKARTQIEEALRESEERFRIIFENTPFPIVLSHIKTQKIIAVNPAFERVTGISKQICIGKSSLEFNFMKSDVYHRLWKAIAEKGSLDGFPIQVMSHDGSILDVLVYARTININSEPTIFTVSVDITESLKTQKALESSQARFRIIFENTPFPILLTKLNDGNIIDVNPAFERITGLKAIECTGKSALDIGILADPIDDERLANQLIQVGYINNEPIKAITPNGQIHDMLIFSRLIDIHEEPTVLTLAFDITELKNTQNDLQESEERFRAIFAHTPFPIALNNIETGIIVDVNPAFEQVTGIKAVDCIGTSAHYLSIFVNPDDRQRLLNKLTTDGFIDNDHIQTRYRNGDIHDILLFSRIIALHGEPTALTLSFDITELKRTQEALQESEALFRSQFEYGNIGIAIAQADKTWIRVNKRLCDMLGYTEEEILSNTWMDVTHPEDLSMSVLQFDRMVNGEIDSYEYDKRYIHKDGHTIYVHVTVSCFRNLDNTVRFAIGSFQDISEKKKAELKLHAAYEQLQAAEEELLDQYKTLAESEEALASRIKYETGLSACSQELLKGTETSFVAALTHLLNSADVSRIYIFENFEDPVDGLCMRQTHEVCALGVNPEIDNTTLLHLPYKNGFTRWADSLSIGKPIVGIVTDFPKEERDILETQNILSMLVLPVSFSGNWYGFIGFDDTKTLRKWDENDINLLQTAAAMIGNYFQNKIIENALQESEALFRTQFEFGNIGILISSFEKKWIRVNKRLCEMLDYTQEELHEKSWIGFTHPDDIEESSKPFYQLMNGEIDSYKLDKRYIRKDGSIIFVHMIISCLPIPSPDDTDKIFIASFQDITKRKKYEEELQASYEQLQAAEETLHEQYKALAASEEALREREERFRLLFESSSDAITISDDKFLPINCNSAALKMFGYKDYSEYSQISPKDLAPLYQPDGRTSLEYIYEIGEFITRNGSAQFEWLQKRSNGELFHAHISVNSFIMEGKKYYQFRTQDITARKLAEEALDSRIRYEKGLSACSQELLKGNEEALLESLRHLLKTADVSRVYIFENFHDPSDGLCMRKTHEVCATGIKPEIDNIALQHLPYKTGYFRWSNILSSGEPIFGLVEDFPTIEGDFLASLNIISILVLPITYSSTWYGFIGFDDAITRRLWNENDINLLKTAAAMIGNYIETKKAEKELKENQRKLTTLFGNLPGMAYRSEKDKENSWMMTFVSSGSYELTGYQPNDLINDHCVSYHKLVNPKDLKAVSEEIHKALSLRESFKNIYRINDACGKEKWVWEQGVGIFSDNDRLIAIEGFIMDITDRKNAEDSLKENEIFLKETQKIARLGGWKANPYTDFLYWDDEIFDILEIPKGKQPTFTEGGIYFPPDARPVMLGNLKKCLSTGEPFNFECNTTTISNKTIWVEIRGIELVIEGERSYVIGTFQDITERKQVEEALQKSEHALREEAIRRRILVDKSRDGIVIFNENGKVFEANQMYASTLGYSMEEITQLHVWDIDIQWTKEQLIERIRKVDETGSHFETQHQRNDGSIYDVEISSNGVFLGRQKLVFCVCRDITARKREQEALKISEATLSSIFRVAPVGIGVVLNRIVQWINDKACEMVGYKKEELIGQDVFKVYPDREEYERVGFILYNNIKNIGTTTVEAKWKHKNGKIINVILSTTPFDQNNLSKEVTFTALDITERNRTLKALQESEERYRLIFETSNDAIMTLSPPSWKYVTANPASLALFGATSLEEFCTKEPLELSPSYQPDGEKSSEKSLKILDTVMANGFHYFEWTHRRMNGEEFPATVLLTKFELYGQTILQSTVRDITLQKEAEEKIRNEMMFTDTIINSLPGTFFVFNSQGKLLRYNNNFASIAAYPPEELSNIPMLEFVAEKDREFVKQKINEIFQNGYAIIEARALTKNKEEPNFLLTGVRMDVGNESYIVGTGQDITERKRAEQALRDSEEQYRVLFESSRDAMMTISPPSWKFVTTNSACLELFGVKTLNDITKMTPLELSPAYQPDGERSDIKFKVIIEKVQQEGVHFFEWTHKRMNGEDFIASVLLTKLEIQNQQIIQATVRDITKQKKAEEEILETKQWLTDIINFLPDPTFVIDREHKVLAWNNALEVMTGVPEIDLIGKGNYEYSIPFYGERRPILIDLVFLPESEFKNKYKSIKREGHTISGETFVPNVYQCKGAILWGKASILFDRAGNVIGAIESVRDISEHINAENERLELERQLLHSQKLESIGILAGGIAHDFNNLLMAILGNLDLALMDLSPTSPTRYCIQQAIQATRRASDLTRQMLAYSGKGRFMVEPMDLKELVKENVELFRTAISRKITLNLSLDTQPSIIEADAGQIQQVIMNLITNASEAIEEKPGVITLKNGETICDYEYLKNSRLEQKPDAGNFAFVEVSDTGCGMDDETLRQIFDPFFTTKFTGRGLGMSAVLGIVRGHNGAIFVNSSLHNGTTIRVLFPVCKTNLLNEEKAIDSALFELQDIIKTSTILIVDDDEAVRNLCEAFIQKLGFQSITAIDGEEAIEKFKEHINEITCVILDLTMPKMDGVSTFREIKKLNPETKILLSSGYNEQEAINRFSKEGLSGFIQKPYDLQEMTEKIYQILKNPNKP